MGYRRRSRDVARLSATTLAAVVAVVAATLAAAGSTTVNISPETNATYVGDSLSQTLLPSYAGMGIEPSNLPAFAGTDEVNPLTYGCLENLRNFTGVPSHLRIGGNTGDNVLYNASYTEGYDFKSNTSSNSLTSNWYYGPKFYQMLDRLPVGTPLTFQLNLAYNGSDSVDRIVEQATSALDELQHVTVAGLEVGNEPDLYIRNNYRPDGYSMPEYGTEWLKHVQAIHQRVLVPRNRSSDFFEVAVTATTADQNGHPFRIANLVQDQEGVANGNGIYISGFNQHDYLYYLGVSDFPITSDWLLNMDNTYQQFQEWKNQAGQAKHTGKK